MLLHILGAVVLYLWSIIFAQIITGITVWIVKVNRLRTCLEDAIFPDEDDYTSNIKGLFFCFLLDWTTEYQNLTFIFKRAFYVFFPHFSIFFHLLVWHASLWWSVCKNTALCIWSLHYDLSLSLSLALSHSLTLSLSLSLSLSLAILPTQNQDIDKEIIFFQTSERLIMILIKQPINLFHFFFPEPQTVGVGKKHIV